MVQIQVSLETKLQETRLIHKLSILFMNTIELILAISLSIFRRTVEFQVKKKFIHHWGQK